MSGDQPKRDSVRKCSFPRLTNLLTARPWEVSRDNSSKNTRNNSFMGTSMDRQACKACARAKRRCGKQMPCCRRCQHKGVECSYPPPKPTSFVLMEQPALEFDSSLDLPEEPPSVTSSVTPPCLTRNINAPSPLELAEPPQQCLARHTDLTWFLTLEAWKIDHRPLPDSSSFCNADLKYFVKTIQRWLAMWISAGSNPFIHSHLYDFRFPCCLQVAYTTLSSYINRTESNTELILRIVDDRSSQLLADSSVLDSLGEDDSIPSLDPPDILDKLAQVHSLIVYQAIGLFDGDIRSRYLAEARMVTLDRWATQLVQSASKNQRLQEALVDSFPHTKSGPTSLPHLTGDTESLWRAWILTESVRRTWHIAKGLQALYWMIQQGWTNCPGGMMFTTHRAIWAADTALAWKNLCSEVDVGFVQRFETEKYLTEANPPEIDEFTEVMLEMTFGKERASTLKLNRMKGK